MLDPALYCKVKKGDTLSGIAHRHGTTIEKLQKINRIKDPDQLKIGQVIALKAEAVSKVDILLLDHERIPIKKGRMRIDHSGKSEKHTSGEDGRLPTIKTNSPDEVIKIFIERTNGTWKKIAETTSDWHNKLLTLVSPKTKYDGKTMPHPKDADDMPIPDPKRTDRKWVHPPEIPETAVAKGRPYGDYGDGKGPKIESKKTAEGLPIEKVTNDQVKLDFLGGYTGEKITEEDFQKAAAELECEVNVIKAIREQESQKLKDLGLGSFDKKNRPTILYERHRFSGLTKNKYDHTNPDISSPLPYKDGTARPKGKPFDDGQHYGLFAWQYKKLAKAYALDKEAAISSCSWGAFQVMGENYKSCGFSSAFDFAKAMSKSELEHLKAMVAYGKAKKLETALKNKDWKAIAIGYNGPKYKKNKYDRALKLCYDKLNK